MTNPKIQDLDDICLYHNMAKGSFVRTDVSKEDKPLYKCLVCPDIYNEKKECILFRSVNYYKHKKIMYES